MSTQQLEFPPALAAGSSAGRVLVVDDHLQARQSIADVLRRAGHRVECLASAVEALKRLERESFDVVITDLQMPGMSGLEFIRHLERRPHGAQVLMITAHASVASAVDAMRHGAFDYIEKPFDVDQLEQWVAARCSTAACSIAGPMPGRPVRSDRSR